MKEIKENSDQCNFVSEQVANNFSKVNNGTNEIGTMANHVKERARELAQVVDNLKAMISQFKI